jgi:hypothetical protein
MSVPVYILHGLYLHGVVMLPLAQYLRQHGFRPILFSYASLLHTPAVSAERLVEQVLQRSHNHAHYVAHSLGGLVLRHVMATYAPHLPPGRSVTLGTPHQGSIVASHVQRYGYGDWLLGASRHQGLLGDAPPWPPERELGSVAGNSGHGIGSLLAPLIAPHDGTVTVAETYCPGQSDHICIDCSHARLLFSPMAERQVLAFLRTGRFQHEESRHCFT